MAEIMIVGVWSSTRVFIRNENYEGDTIELLPYESWKLRNHSPDGFNWGYCGSGPAQLALALLLYYTKDKNFSCRWYQEFKEQVIAWLPQTDFEIPESKITDWIKVKKESHKKICEKQKTM